MTTTDTAAQVTAAELTEWRGLSLGCEQHLRYAKHELRLLLLGDDGQWNPRDEHAQIVAAGVLHSLQQLRDQWLTMRADPLHYAIIRARARARLHEPPVVAGVTLSTWHDAAGHLLCAFLLGEPLDDDKVHTGQPRTR